MRRAVFLDRDGVLNETRGGSDGTSRPPFSVSDLVLLPTVEESCAMLRTADFVLVVVTNQPDVARGLQTRAAVEAINSSLRALLPVQDILVCFHDDADGCDCRKPKPGLLLEGARQFAIDLSESFMVGDRRVDVEAGRSAGCSTALVGCSAGETNTLDADFRGETLLDATRWILDLPAGSRTEART